MLLNINKFNKVSLSQSWHLFCFLMKRTYVLHFGLNFSFGLQKIRFGIFHEGIIHQFHT